ncbi:J domain-containing protein [Helicobacter pametensis]|uniref:J domain-containing protein n=1 Tax=Helicobacter pametensis TaxID=95149 RepID=UPI0004870F18|nr:J domain-containing protein [Helicobacter pametensis]
MRFETYPQFLQITIEENCALLEKILIYAKRHFHQVHRLSNTLLILDDTRLIKKRYFLNWLFCLQEIPVNEDFLEKAYLPIQIKIIPLESLLYRIDAKVKVVDHSSLQILLLHDDQRARHCVLQLFKDYVRDRDALILDSSRKGFWEYLMEIIHSRVADNLILHLDFEVDSNWMQHEGKLEQSYRILDSYLGENFTQIRKKYIKLAKQYHPDNVFDADCEVIQDYQQRFIQIQSAFDNICASLK